MLYRATEAGVDYPALQIRREDQFRLSISPPCFAMLYATSNRSAQTPPNIKLK
jgi:hypothetical protein